MPRNPDISIDEYDRIHWQILHASPTISAPQLSRDYGIPNKTISRWRREPWVCTVEYKSCKWCGELVTSSPSNKLGNKRKYHPECYRLQRGAWSREDGRERFHALDESARKAKIDELAELGREGALRRYNKSIRSAVNHGEPWSDEDIAWLRDNYEYRDIVEIARYLGRTTYAVRAKLFKMDGPKGSTEKGR